MTRLIRKWKRAQITK
jgi:hypothetical protein